MRPKTVRELALVQQEQRRALEHQASEYERRLDALNHAHEQAQERNAEFVSNDVFRAYVEAADKKAEALVIARTGGHQSLRSAVIAIVAAMIVLSGVIVTILVATR